MTSYVVGGLSATSTVSNELVELRVLSNLIQQYNGGQASQEDLRFLRNDQAFELGIIPPVVPGQ